MMNSNYFMHRKVLVTGGLGFIGSHLCEAVLKGGASVTIIDNLMPNYGGNRFNIASISDKINLIEGDVRDEMLMKNAVRGVDFIFNLAGQTSHMDSMTDPYTDLDINCRAQISILEACRHAGFAGKIIYASTRQVYGKPAYLPVDEKHPLCPVDANGINKLSGEWYHILYNNVYGVRCSSLRLTNTYGPHMRIKDDRQTFLGVWVRNVLQNMPIEVWGGEQLRDLCYVSDAVDALLAVASSKDTDGMIFNVGGGPGVSLMQLAGMLIEEAGQGECLIKPFPVDRRKIDIGDYYANDDLLRNTVGWKPMVDLRQGLRKTVDFYKKNLANYL